MADEIRADYEQLKSVAERFSRQSESVSDMLRRVQGSMSKLKDGWIGRGSDAFFAEMGDEVLPAAGRLRQALGEAASITQKIGNTVKQAEEEASAPFRTGGVA